MTKEEIRNYCLDEIKDCLIQMSTLQSDRAKRIKYYRGEPFGNEVANRSKYVVKEALAMVEAVMPDLMRIFLGSADVVNVTAREPQYENAAKLMEEKLNWDFTIANDGYLQTYDAFKDGLICDLSVIKYWWEKGKKYGNKKELKGITLNEFMAVVEMAKTGQIEVLKEKRNVVKEAQTYQDEFTEEKIVINPAEVNYDISYREVELISEPRFQAIPPEEFIFDITAKDLSESFCAHRKKVPFKKLKKYGITEQDISDSIQRIEVDPVFQERFKDLGSIKSFWDNEKKEATLYECYYPDYDDEGNIMPQKCLMVGDIVVEYEDNNYGKPPFCVGSPIREPHRILGTALTDLAMDMQELKSVLMRYCLDNIYFQNNGRYIYDPLRVNAQDFLKNNFPGGGIRTRNGANPSEAVVAMNPAPIAPQFFNIWNLVSLESQHEEGISDYTQGLGSKTLNKTAHGISQILNRAMARVELIARNYSEMLFKDLFEADVQMNLDFFDQTIFRQINGKWVEITPKSIKGKFNLIVDVGTGTGAKEIKAQQMMTYIQTVLSNQIFLQLQIVTPENIKASLRALFESWGYKNVDLYVNNAMQAVQAGNPQIGGMSANNRPNQGGSQPAGGSPGITGATVSGQSQIGGGSPPAY